MCVHLVSTYMARKQQLPGLIDRVAPDLVFFQGGIDPLESDRLGALKLTQAGISQRNALVYKSVIGAGIRCCITMGGGYPRVSTNGLEHRTVHTSHAV